VVGPVSKRCAALYIDSNEKHKIKIEITVTNTSIIDNYRIALLWIILLNYSDRCGYNLCMKTLSRIYYVIGFNSILCGLIVFHGHDIIILNT